VRDLLSAALKKAVMLNWTKKRIDNNKNLILIINGETGSGKTFAGLRFAVDCANMFGTNFSIKNNVDFNFIKLLEKMEYIEDNKQPGTVFFFEEVGAVGSGAGSKQWQTKANQFFSSFAQTSRHLRQIFIMTCPSFSNLQKDTRELCHMQWEMMGINMQNKHSFAKARRIQVNRTSGKMYMKYLRFVDEGRKFTLKRLDMDLPPKDVIDNYERAKNIFTSALNKRIIDSGTSKLKKLTETQQEVFNLIKVGTSIEDMARIRGVSTRSIYDVKKSIEKAGYFLENAGFEAFEGRKRPL